MDVKIPDSEYLNRLRNQGVSIEPCAYREVGDSKRTELLCFLMDNVDVIQWETNWKDGLKSYMATVRNMTIKEIDDLYEYIGIVSMVVRIIKTRKK